MHQGDHDSIVSGRVVSSSTGEPPETQRKADSRSVLGPSNRGAESVTESGILSWPRPDTGFVRPTSSLNRGRELLLLQQTGIRRPKARTALTAEEITPPQTPKADPETIIVGVDMGLTYTGTYAEASSEQGESRQTVNVRRRERF